jgi:small subunit ribosomal protein S17
VVQQVEVSSLEGSRGIEKVAIGEVVSTKMAKTAVVLVRRQVEHPVYKKVVKRSKKFLVHDEEQKCSVGDVVRIVECRPLSRHKRWKLRDIVKAAAQ